MRLYELSENYRQVLDLIDEGAEVDTLHDTLESIEGAIEEKAEGIAKVILGMTADINAIKAEEKRLADRRRALENRQNWLKAYVQFHMEKTGLKKIKLPTVTISVQNNPPSVECETSKLPSQFVEQRIDYIPRKKELMKALKAGKKIEGAELRHKKSLRIR